jgi:hypoxanthine phosphoribosyltransferase
MDTPREGTFLNEAPSVKTLITAGELQRRVREMAEAVSRDHAGVGLVLVCVREGARVFCRDLAGLVTTPHTVADIRVESYGRSTESSGHVRLVEDLTAPVNGKAAVIVEDIVDTGSTLEYVRRHVQAKGAASVRVCVMLDKRERRRVETPLDYVGFTIPDVFVVGYGMDLDGAFRDLPYVGYAAATA